MLLPPVILEVTDKSVKLSISPPAGALANKVLKYVIKYRMVADSAWKSTPEESTLSRTVDGLDAASLYEFKAVAKYEGETETSESVPIQVKTGESKLLFPSSDCSHHWIQARGSVA